MILPPYRTSGNAPDGPGPESRDPWGRAGLWLCGVGQGLALDIALHLLHGAPLGVEVALTIVVLLSAFALIVVVPTLRGRRLGGLRCAGRGSGWTVVRHGGSAGRARPVAVLATIVLSSLLTTGVLLAYPQVCRLAQLAGAARYWAPHPGPGCDMGRGRWSARTAQTTTRCVPDGLELAATLPDARSLGEVSLPLAGLLPATMTARSSGDYVMDVWMDVPAISSRGAPETTATAAVGTGVASRSFQGGDVALMGPGGAVRVDRYLRSAYAEALAHGAYSPTGPDALLTLEGWWSPAGTTLRVLVNGQLVAVGTDPGLRAMPDVLLLVVGGGPGARQATFREVTVTVLAAPPPLCAA